MPSQQHRLIQYTSKGIIAEVQKLLVKLWNEHISCATLHPDRHTCLPTLSYRAAPSDPSLLDQLLPEFPLYLQLANTHYMGNYKYIFPWTEVFLSGLKWLVAFTNNCPKVCRCLYDCKHQPAFGQNSQFSEQSLTVIPWIISMMCWCSSWRQALRFIRKHPIKKFERSEMAENEDVLKDFQKWCSPGGSLSPQETFFEVTRDFILLIDEISTRLCLLILAHYF